MKCKYCGAEIGNSIECHLCGHKQIGKRRCGQFLGLIN